MARSKLYRPVGAILLLLGTTGASGKGCWGSSAPSGSGDDAGTPDAGSPPPSSGGGADSGTDSSARADARPDGADDAIAETGADDAPASTDVASDASGADASDAPADALDSPDTAMASNDVGTSSSGVYEAWPNWPMPNPPGTSLPNPQSYDTSVAGVVRDQVTGLVWEQDILSDAATWSAAKTRCDGLVLAGYDDWRLPSRIEAVSIQDFTRTGPAMNPVFHMPASYSPNSFVQQWTSTRSATDPSLVWASDLYSETVMSGTSTAEDPPGATLEFVRCVRSGPLVDAAPPSRYVVKNGTVHDELTKLTWQQAPSGVPVMASGSAQVCTSLSLDGSGWRLPSLNELETLVDETVPDNTAHALDTTSFPNEPGSVYWSSSQMSSYMGVVAFTGGGSMQLVPVSPTAADLLSGRGLGFVRCVR